MFSAVRQLRHELVVGSTQHPQVAGVVAATHAPSMLMVDFEEGAPRAAPTIVEDDCFIGARSEIVEGVIVEQGAVISMGVFIGQSTRIYDRERDEVIQGRVPAGAVVVPGSLPATNGRYALSCAVIVKRVDAKTRARTGINELLRGID